MKAPLYYICLFILLCCTSLNATATMDCYWHAAYFNAQFTGNYGTEQETQYKYDVVIRAQVIMQLDSVFRELKKRDELPSFKRWFLVDHYHVSYDYVKGKKLPCELRIQHDTVYLCMTDSISINQALKKLWHINDVIISPHKKSGMWLYSLHIKTTTNEWYARNYPDTLDGYPLRRDAKLLWLHCEGGYTVFNCFYQHEIDGFFHQYTGLYLTTNNVVQAQKNLLEYHGLKTAITSQYVTPAILNKYIWY